MANSFQQRMNKAIKALKQHKDQPISREIPKYLKEYKLFGELTKERADEIIKQYEKPLKYIMKLRKNTNKLIIYCIKMINFLKNEYQKMIDKKKNTIEKRVIRERPLSFLLHSL